MPNKRILVIEDEQELIMAIKIRLEAAGFEVITASDGMEGIEKAKKEKPDLIVLDLLLPKMDGYKVCGLLKKDIRFNKIPVIMLTAKAQDQDVKLGMELGANAYIIKPFDYKVVIAKIDELLKG